MKAAAVVLPAGIQRNLNVRRRIVGQFESGGVGAGTPIGTRIRMAETNFKLTLFGDSATWYGRESDESVPGWVRARASGLAFGMK